MSSKMAGFSAQRRISPTSHHALPQVPLADPPGLLAAAAAGLTLFYSRQKNVMILGKQKRAKRPLSRSPSRPGSRSNLRSPSGAAGAGTLSDSTSRASAPRHRADEEACAAASEAAAAQARAEDAAAKAVAAAEAADMAKAESDGISLASSPLGA